MYLKLLWTPCEYTSESGFQSWTLLSVSPLASSQQLHNPGEVGGAGSLQGVRSNVATWIGSGYLSPEIFWGAPGGLYWALKADGRALQTLQSWWCFAILGKRRAAIHLLMCKGGTVACGLSGQAGADGDQIGLDLWPKL